MSVPRELLSQLTASQYSHADRAVAVLWYLHRGGDETPRTARELADEIEAAGYPTQNATRLAKQLQADRRVVSRKGAFRIGVSAVEDLDAEWSDLLGPQLPPPTDSVLPLELFFDTRGYIERVVRQCNTSYDNALYDCCAVMLRRLMETLIIHVYEHEGREGEIKGRDGNYLFLSGLVGHIKKDQTLSLSRNTQKALESCKALGDLSAHNRRYNAVRDDIDRVRHDSRVAAQELLVMGGLR